MALEENDTSNRVGEIITRRSIEGDSFDTFRSKSVIVDEKRATFNGWRRAELRKLDIWKKKEEKEERY